jgi:hypothetical protein
VAANRFVLTPFVLTHFVLNASIFFGAFFELVTIYTLLVVCLFPVLGRLSIHIVANVLGQKKFEQNWWRRKKIGVTE